MSTEYGPAPLKRYEGVSRNLRLDHHVKGGPRYEVVWKKGGKLQPPEPLPLGIGIREAEKMRTDIMARVNGSATTKATTFDRTRTIKDLKDVYWADHDPDNQNVVIDERWKPTTLRKYDGNWRNYIGGDPETGRLKGGERPFLSEHLKLVDVDPDVHLEPMLAYMGEHLSPKSKGIAWGIVTGMFEYAVELEWMRPAQNPCGMVRKQVKPKTRKRSKQEKRALALKKIVPESELRLILSAFRRPVDLQWQDVIKVGAKLGLRPSETLGLCLDQVEDGYVCIDRQLAERFEASKPETWFEPAKNEYGDDDGNFIPGNGRRIPIQPDVEALLRKIRLARGFVPTLHPLGYQPLFVTSKGTPHVQTKYNEKWRWALAQVGLEEKVNLWVPHCLRHTYATQRFAWGASIEDVAEELGDTPDVVRDTYVHLIDRADRERIAAEQYQRSFLAAL